MRFISFIDIRVQSLFLIQVKWRHDRVQRSVTDADPGHTYGVDVRVSSVSRAGPRLAFHHEASGIHVMYSDVIPGVLPPVVVQWRHADLDLRRMRVGRVKLSPDVDVLSRPTAWIVLVCVPVLGVSAVKSPGLRVWWVDTGQGGLQWRQVGQELVKLGVRGCQVAGQCLYVDHLGGRKRKTLPQTTGRSL